MATVTGSRSRHANNGVIKVNGVVVGEVLNISVREGTGADGVYVTGDAKPVEHTHNRWSGMVSISRIVFKKGALARFGVGGASILQLPLLTIEGYDKSDGAMVFKCKDCTLTDRSLNISANQRYASDVQLQALDVVDTDANGNPISSTADGDNPNTPASTVA